ncbi:MAG TPA: tRNA 4-thiouridine(8) synthase ThiI, partial [Acidilobales archaeon]|nr:tRNA 4-thiouridine(8) synthase ThiI [Acidilobales archaeon]
MMYLVRLCGEIALKSRRTRWRFEKRLVSNLENALERFGVKDYNLRLEDGRIFIEGPDGIEGIVKRVFGIHSVSKVYHVRFKDLNDLVSKAEEYFKEFVKGKKFAVRTHRVGVHEFTSIDVNKEVGARLKPYSAGVDLNNPDVTTYIEVRGRDAYFFTNIIKGYDGLPTGVEGTTLLLFSGGFDSPVAAWLLARRGIEVHFLHYVLTSQSSILAAYRVAKYLADNWLFGYEPMFYVIDLRSVVAEIINYVRSDYRQVVLRKIMYLIADELREKLDIDSLATGESIGQASSQTLKNLVATEEGIKSLILRPLTAMDKEEIMRLSKEIGTYELSSDVVEYCSISVGPVATRARKDILEKELSKVRKELIDRALSDLITINLVKDPPSKLKELTDIEIDFIPSDALVIDARSIEEYR